jgi:hypothetical protein
VTGLGGKKFAAHQDLVRRSPCRLCQTARMTTLILDRWRSLAFLGRVGNYCAPATNASLYCKSIQ